MSNIHTPTDQVLSKCLDLGTLSTANSQSVDTLGYTRAKVVIAATTAASSTLDAALYEAPDNSTFVAVSGGAITTIPASQTRLVRTISVNLEHRERYLRISETVSGTVSGSITIELYNADDMPVSQDSTPLVVN
jgi:hypothetical protein